MISRRSTKRLAELYLRMFRRSKGVRGEFWVPWDPVYDFLFERDFDADFCSAAKYAARSGPRTFEEFILRLHTGESVSSFRASPPLTAPAEGQGFLRKLSLAALTVERPQPPKGMARETYEALVGASESQLAERREALALALELDGYVLRSGQLMHLESAIVDVERQYGALMDLARTLKLGKIEVFEHHLDRSEEHYAQGHWDDSIVNARKFLESSLRECAARFSETVLGEPLDGNVYGTPRLTRDFLRDQQLLSEKEFMVIKETYGLLSETGGHPNIAANDQARMLRQVALLYSEFVMLRLKGRLAAPSSP